MDKPRVLLLEEVAAILRRESSTVQKDMSSNPERVPPWFKYPGAKTPMWYEHKVYEWLDAVAGCDVVQPKRRGRPRLT